MYNNKQVHYFGKLRRRREFVKADGLPRDYYYNWESWFNKCSTTNSLLPFLSSKSKLKPMWLFMVINDETMHVGFTTLSSDMADRKYPFLVYFDNHIDKRQSYDELISSVLAIADKYEGFVKTVTNGDFTIEDKNYFEATGDTYQVADQLQELLKNIVLNIVNNNEYSVMSSYWINLYNFSSITHKGALTCTLYNKIYG